MTPPPSIDMAEVMRLTRAGRLHEAMALLQGRGRPLAPSTGRAVPPRGTGGAEHTPPTLDLAAPAGPGGAWGASDATGDESEPGASQAGKGGPAAPQGVAGALHRLRERLPGMGALADLGAGLGSGFGSGLGAARRPTASAPLPSGARFEARQFTGEAGQRAYKLYVPSGYRPGHPLPLVVMLHGCTQSPDDFAAGTRMNALAEEGTFLVAYPAQTRSANAQGCWNWFNPADQRREGGEPALVAGITRAVMGEFGADPARVYVAGLSAGGAAACVLASTYPDLYAAVGVHSGLACGAARDVGSALAAMKGGGALRSREGHVTIPMIVFHGDADRTVSAVNGDQVAAQAVPPGAPEAVVTRGEAPGGRSYTRRTRADASGRAVMEHWVLHGAGHAWSGGSPEGSYTDPHGPDASGEMVRFFLAHAKAPGHGGADRAP